MYVRFFDGEKSTDFVVVKLGREAQAFYRPEGGKWAACDGYAPSGKLACYMLDGPYARACAEVASVLDATFGEPPDSTRVVFDRVTLNLALGSTRVNSHIPGWRKAGYDGGTPEWDIPRVKKITLGDIRLTDLMTPPVVEEKETVEMAIPSHGLFEFEIDGTKYTCVRDPREVGWGEARPEGVTSDDWAALKYAKAALERGGDVTFATALAETFKVGSGKVVTFAQALRAAYKPYFKSLLQKEQAYLNYTVSGSSGEDVFRLTTERVDLYPTSNDFYEAVNPLLLKAGVHECVISEEVSAGGYPYWVIEFHPVHDSHYDRLLATHPGKKPTEFRGRGPQSDPALAMAGSIGDNRAAGGQAAVRA